MPNNPALLQLACRLQGTYCEVAMKREDKILIVEDNPMFADALEKAGERCSFTCDRATDGWDAIEKLETERYAAIVIDADVPRHSGFGVLNYLREEGGDQFDHVILMTSADPKHLTERYRDERVTVVGKTVEVEELARLIGDCTE